MIPQSLRKRVIDILQTSHFGIEKIKHLARTAVYWPGLDFDIEEQCRNCTSCGEHQNNQPKMKNYSWMLPEKPWSRIHVDQAVNFMGNNWLVIVDAYFKIPMHLSHPNRLVKDYNDTIGRNICTFWVST